MNYLQRIEKSLQQFPKSRAIFGYGSGVMKQSGYKASDLPMVDLIIVPRGSSASWHRENLRLHQHHYSWPFRLLGSAAVTQFQRMGFGAQISYHPFVQLQGLPMKYGVVELEDLLTELREWKHLYLAGRLQKPVKIFQEQAKESKDREDELAASLQQNLNCALRCAVLLLPRRFSEHQLYEKITSLSYDGDVRMLLAENPRKKRNIVEGNFKGFQLLYGEEVKRLQGLLLREDPTKSLAYFDQQNVDRRYLLADLPGTVRQKLQSALEFKGQAVHGQDFSEWAAKLPPATVQQALAKSLRAIVRKSSATQTLKGLLTAGIVKSFQYSLQKIGKRFVK